MSTLIATICAVVGIVSLLLALGTYAVVTREDCPKDQQQIGKGVLGYLGVVSASLISATIQILAY